MKSLQNKERSPVAIKSTYQITQTWMTENIPRHHFWKAVSKTSDAALKKELCQSKPATSFTYCIIILFKTRIIIIINYYILYIFQIGRLDKKSAKKNPNLLVP